MATVFIVGSKPGMPELSGCGPEEHARLRPSRRVAPATLVRRTIGRTAFIAIPVITFWIRSGSGVSRNRMGRPAGVYSRLTDWFRCALASTSLAPRHQCHDPDGPTRTALD